MTHLPLVRASFVLVLLVAPAATAAEDTLTTITPEQARGVLSGMGLDFKMVEERSIQFELEGYSVVMLVSESNIQLYAGFKDPCTIQKTNEWNRTKRFSRSYIDAEGDPCIEADLDLEGGVSRDAVKEFVKTFRVSVRSFARFIRE